MSTSLYWRPAPKDLPPARDLPVGLKRAISERLWGHDGSLHGDAIQVSWEMLPYLEGIRDGGTGEAAEGADELIKAIHEHDAVEIWIAE